MTIVQFMPIKPNYLETDLQTIKAATKTEASTAWDSIDQTKALYKMVSIGGELFKVLDYRFCGACSSRLEFCTCGQRKPGLVTFDKGQRANTNSTAFADLLEQIKPRKEVAK